jgi:hypothetical protein
LTAAHLGLLIGIEVALRTLRLPTVCGALGVRLDLHSGHPPMGVWRVPQRYARSTRAVFRATRWWPFGDTCLRQCLLLGRTLRHEAPVMRIGVQRDDKGSFSAHSWLEVEGQTLDPMAADFSLLHTPPAPGVS